MNLSQQDAEQMRAILRDYDKSNPRKSDVGKVIDMSQPVIVPYSFKPFPKLVYNHDECKPSRFETKESALPGGKPETRAMPPVFATKTVNSQEELDAALADGWKAEAPNFEATPKRRKVA